mgnify:FL=1|tara:strand:+ start:2514 stop:2936 length:423 start_codon:yes stop_codon:yes gene_type:complete
MKKKWSNLREKIREEWHFLRNRKVEFFSLLILGIFSLSALDAFFTLMWIKSGLAVEANPFLKDLIEHGDFSFLATKISLTGLGCLFLESVKDKSKFAKIAIISLFAVYIFLTAYHMYGALQSVDHSYLPDFVNEALVFTS